MIGGEEQGVPIAIGHVTADGPAEGMLQVYDEIRTVNGQSVLGAYHTSVIELIGQAAAYQGKVSLLVRRHRDPELLFKMAGLHLPDLDTARFVHFLSIGVLFISCNTKGPKLYTM